MKKIILILGLIAGVSAQGWAQYQLSNPGFDSKWGACIPWLGKSSSEVQGTTPDGWCVANVIGVMGFNATVGEPDTDRTGGSEKYSCKLVNSTISGQVVPGYVSLGTTWNTAKGLSGGSADGGSWGGVSFIHTPDAIEFYYKRIVSDIKQPASVVAYMWKGSTSQEGVPVGVVVLGSPKTYTMENRDRNILGMDYDQGGDVTYDNFSLIASLMSDVTYIENDQQIVRREHIVKLSDEKISWTRATYEFTYHNDTDKPTMINVVFGAMDYFVPRSNHIAGNTLIVDDVRLLYYSELASGSYNGNALVVNEDGTIEDVDEVYAEQKISLKSNGHGATIEKSYDEATSKLTITVKGEDISENASNFHTYTIQFAKKGDVNGDKQVTIADVTALVNIILGKDSQKAIADVNGDGSVTIADVTALVNIILGK